MGNPSMPMRLSSNQRPPLKGGNFSINAHRRDAARQTAKNDHWPQTHTDEHRPWQTHDWTTCPAMNRQALRAEQRFQNRKQMQPPRVPQISLEVVRQKEYVNREAMALFRPAGSAGRKSVCVCVGLWLKSSPYGRWISLTYSHSKAGTIRQADGLRN